MIHLKDDTQVAIADLTKELQLKRKAPSAKREWLQARLDGFEKVKYTGRTVYVVEWNQGGISRLREEIFQSATIAP